MIPLAIQLVSTFAPMMAGPIGNMLAGAKGEAVAKQVVSIAERVTGMAGQEAVNAMHDKPELLLEFQNHLLSAFETEVKAQRDVIVAEAQSESWITRNWRPLTMLTFVGLLVAKWFGFTAPGVTEAEQLSLMEIIKYGLSGYVAGRSAEKIAPMLAGMFSKK